MGCTGSRGGKSPDAANQYNAYDLTAWLGGADMWAPPFDGGVNPHKDPFTPGFSEARPLLSSSDPPQAEKAGADVQRRPPADIAADGAPLRPAANKEAAAPPSAVAEVAPSSSTTSCNPGSLWLLLWPGSAKIQRRPSAPTAKDSAPRKSSVRRRHGICWYWLEELLGTIASGDAIGLAVDLAQQQPGTPLFVVAGSCPNSFCGMQAVVFCKVGCSVDFWWIKPQADHPEKLEQNTMNLHMQGRYKNVAESSKAVYGPLADKFSGGSAGDDGLRYGVTSCGRAYIDEVRDGRTTRMFVYLVWQETWSGFFAVSMYMTGKIYYQKAAVGAVPAQGPRAQYFARHYRIQDGAVILAPLDEHPEELVPCAFPPEIAAKGE